MRLDRALLARMPVPDARAMLTTAFDYVWQRLDERLEGLTDAEFFWEPVPDCWSVREAEDGNWYLDHGDPDAEPPSQRPFTTIAWRLCHLAITGVAGYTDVLFEGLPPAEQPQPMPGSAADALAALSSHYARWQRGLRAMDRLGWWRRLGDSFGPYAESTRLDLAVHVFDEFVHHGAEMALLRDLYLRRGQLRG
jgi:hypothetical protein